MAAMGGCAAEEQSAAEPSRTSQQQNLHPGHAADAAQLQSNTQHMAAQWKPLAAERQRLTGRSEHFSRSECAALAAQITLIEL